MMKFASGRCLLCLLFTLSLSLSRFSFANRPLFRSGHVCALLNVNVNWLTACWALPRHHMIVTCVRRSALRVLKLKQIHTHEHTQTDTVGQREANLWQIEVQTLLRTSTKAAVQCDRLRYTRYLTYLIELQFQINLYFNTIKLCK